MYYSNNPKIKLLLQEVENEIEDANEREEESKRMAWNVVKIEVIIAIIIIIICVIGAINSPERDGLFGTYKDNDGWICGIICTVIGFAGIITITIKKFCLKEKINFDLNKLMKNLKSATYWVSWDFACKTTKIHFIVHIPCITETS